MTITWIMQVYLGEYRNSPKENEKKFKRAVKSFLAMKDKNARLVIVSDGCQEAHNIYFKEFSKHLNIKYVFVEKTTPRMFEEYNGEIMSSYYRVGTRQLGRSLVDSDLTAYLDSDDVLLPNASNIIRDQWKLAESKGIKINWMLNSRWYDSAKVNEYIENENYYGGEHNFDLLSSFGDPIHIKGLKSRWQEVGVENFMETMASYSMNIIHKSSIKVRWRDSVTGIPGGIRPESAFVQRMLKIKGGIMNTPYYVRCHHSNLWDQ